MYERLHEEERLRYEVMLDERLKEYRRKAEDSPAENSPSEDSF